MSITFAKAGTKDSSFVKHQGGMGISVYLIPSSLIFNGTFNYNLRYHFKYLSARSTLSLNVNTGFAIPGLSYNFLVISHYFQYHMPVTLNLNIGNGATKESSQTSGVYIGAGPCLDFLAMPYSLRQNALSVGPILNGGLRFGQSNSYSNSDARYDLRFSYMFTLNKNGKGLSNILGIDLLYNF